MGGVEAWLGPGLELELELVEEEASRGAVGGAVGGSCGLVGRWGRGTRAARDYRWVVVWLRGVAVRAEAGAGAVCAMHLGLEAGGVVVVVVGRACGRGGERSGGREG